MGSLVKYILFFLVIGQSPIAAPRCLGTLLPTTATKGGWWKVVQKPSGTADIPLPAKGTAGADNPCVDLALYGCGQWKFRYYVESKTCLNCIDSNTYTVNYTKTITGTVTCN